MTTFDAIVLGGLIAIACGILAYTGLKVASLARDLMKSFGDAAQAAVRAAVAANAVAQELAYMRSLQGNQPVVVQPINQVGAGTQIPKAEPPAPPEYPAPFFDRFTPVAPAKVEEPDATKEDTDMDLLEQTDRELSIIEQVEKLRERGIEVEDDDTIHPGVEAASE